MLQPESPSTSETKQQIFDHYLYRLQSEIHTILSAESENEERYKRLETDLEVFKRACFAAETDKRALNDEIRALKSALDAAEAQRGVRASPADADSPGSAESLTPTAPQQTPDRRIVCIIDGDETGFAADLVSKGKDGGRLAAKQLAESILFHLTADQPCHLWTYVYFSRRLLVDAIAAADGATRDAARDVVDEFVAGFNMANERFVMATLGDEKGVVTSKVRASLDFHARSQETYRIVFGGCSSDVYLHQLHSLHLTSVYREKLVLLPAFAEMTPDINDLQLPSLVIPGLFVPDKLEADSRRSNRTFSAHAHSELNANSRIFVFGSSDPLSPPPAHPPHPPVVAVAVASANLKESRSRASSSGSLTPPPPPYQDQDQPESAVPAVSPPRGSNRGEESVQSPSAASERQQRVVLGHASGPVSYHPGLRPRAHSKTMAAPAVDSADKRGGNGDAKVDEFGRSGKQKRIVREVPLSQHNPPPCTLFYLASNGCKHGSDCRFGHDYVLDDEDYELLRMNAKKVPCPSANRGDVCVFGNDCCYGHYCPFSSRCHYYKQGKCKFAGESMHRDFSSSRS